MYIEIREHDCDQGRVDKFGSEGEFPEQSVT